MRKPKRFPNQFCTNRAVQAQKMARGRKVEELYYTCSKNKGADQLRSYCAFVFMYAKCWFSHDVAQMWDFIDAKTSKQALVEHFKIAYRSTDEHWPVLGCIYKHIIKTCLQNGLIKYQFLHLNLLITHITVLV